METQPTAVLRYLSYKDNIKKINLVGEKKSQISTDITNIESIPYISICENDEAVFSWLLLWWLMYIFKELLTLEHQHFS